MKNEKYHIVETVIKSNRKFVERHKIDIPNTQLHEHQICWIWMGTSVKSGRVELVFYGQKNNNNLRIY